MYHICTTYEKLNYNIYNNHSYDHDQSLQKVHTVFKMYVLININWNHFCPYYLVGNNIKLLEMMLREGLENVRSLHNNFRNITTVVGSYYVHSYINYDENNFSQVKTYIP